MIWRDSLGDLIAFEIGQQLNAMFDAGSKLEFFAGAMPASLDDADAGTKIWTKVMNDPPFEAAEETPWRVPLDITGMSANNIATGTMTYWRMKTNAGTVQAQGTMGETGEDFNCSPSNLVSGSKVITVTGFTIPLNLIEFES